MINKLKSTVMRKSRASKLDQFYSLVSETDTVCDVGVTNNEHNDQVNIFLNQFKLPENQYTGLAVEDITDLRLKHPGKNFVEYPGGIFPFSDDEFDWVFSNAVIEHVGDRDKQLEFINEMLRVGKRVFFTTPNKYFPVEAHTNTVFIHWVPKLFYRWCNKNRPYWSERNLVLLSKGNIRGLLNESGAIDFRIWENRFFGFAMTFTILCSKHTEVTIK